MSTDFDLTEIDFESVYGSKYLSASDLSATGGKKRVHITSVEIGEFRQDSGGTRKKFVVFFNALEKAMVLNVTNANTLGAALGKAPASWIGAEIGLFVEQVQFGGKRVPALRLKVLNPPSRRNPAPARSPARPLVDQNDQRTFAEHENPGHGVPGGLEDEIPF